MPINTEPGTVAVIRFLPDWRIIQEGDIRSGGKLIIDYDTGRLPNYRRQRREAVFWQVQIFVKFHPGGQLEVGSPLEPMRSGDHGPVIGYRPKPYALLVPPDALRIELWFYTSDREIGGDSEAWDSQYGQNYWFDVARG
jgi:hypothetical protein